MGAGRAPQTTQYAATSFTGQVKANLADLCLPGIERVGGEDRVIEVELPPDGEHQHGTNGT